MTLNLGFYPVGGSPALAADITLQDTTFGFTILVNNMNLTMHIETFNVDKVVINTDNIGKLRAA
jgi:hypothetical protein